MKIEIILATALMNICIGERQQRSTVLTDESKRILEQFDFSNFDKQEALNYIDRQRYENQIRGKRSQAQLNRNPSKQKSKDESIEDTETQRILRNKQSLKTNVKRTAAENPTKQRESVFCIPKVKENFNELYKQFKINLINEECNIRNKRGYRYKKKNRLKSNPRIDEISYNENIEDDERTGAYEEKSKKRKKKKRHYWNHWTEWSPCSVTCGKGRKIRWRKCIVNNCKSGELEMGEKTCQLPACNFLSKILGL